VAVNPISLVESDLEVVFVLDTTLQARIPDRVAAVVALQGWTLLDLDDQKSVYVAALTTQAFIPRLLLKFAQEIKKAEGGKSKVEFTNAVDYLKALQAQIETILQEYAKHAQPVDVLPLVELNTIRWPGVGPVSWGS
jgi:hypothetical protein